MKLNTLIGLKNKKRLLLTFIVCTVLFIGGCWSNKEVNDLLIITGAGGEKVDDNLYSISIESLQSKHSNDTEIIQSQNSMVNTALGKTISEAARNCSLAVSNKYFWPHSNIFIIHKNLAEDGIEAPMDFYTRDVNKRNEVYFIITDDKVEKILSYKPKDKNSASLEIRNIIKQTDLNGYGSNLNLREYYMKSNYLSGTSLINKFNIQSSKKLHGNYSENKAELFLSSIAVLYKNKFIGELTLKENMMVNFITNRIKRCEIPIIDDKKNELTFIVKKSRAKIMPEIKNDKYIVNVNFEVHGDIDEYSGSAETTSKKNDEISTDI